MKMSKLFLFSLVAVAAASQARAEAEIGLIFKAGESLITAVQSRGIRVPLNAIVCVDAGPTGSVESLIYSYDFRHDGSVFVIKGNELTTLSKEEAQIVEKGGARTKDMIQQTNITMQGRPFVCESSILVLE